MGIGQGIGEWIYRGLCIDWLVSVVDWYHYRLIIVDWSLCISDWLICIVDMHWSIIVNMHWYALPSISYLSLLSPFSNQYRLISSSNLISPFLIPYLWYILRIAYTRILHSDIHIQPPHSFLSIYRWWHIRTILRRRCELFPKLPYHVNQVPVRVSTVGLDILHTSV